MITRMYEGTNRTQRMVPVPCQNWRMVAELGLLC